jgi:hypothetical protein
MGARFGNVAAMDRLDDDGPFLLGTFNSGAPSCGLWNINRERPLMLVKDLTSPTKDVRIFAGGKRGVFKARNQAELRSLEDGSFDRQLGRTARPASR